MNVHSATDSVSALTAAGTKASDPKAKSAPINKEEAPGDSSPEPAWKQYAREVASVQKNPPAESLRDSVDKAWKETGEHVAKETANETSSSEESDDSGANYAAPYKPTVGIQI